jgi:glycosyltransferase involved in cell wall biosynthesis
MMFSEWRRARRIFCGATGIVSISDAYLRLALDYAGRDQNANDGIFLMGYPAAAGISPDIISLRRDELAARYGLSGDELVLTFVGSSTTAFDLPTVIEAARKISQTDSPPVRFVIVGEGDELKPWQAQAAGLKNIVFTGWFDEASVHAILGLSSAGLAPYRSDSVISLPNKPFEYMSAGLPLLSSLRGELENLIHTKQIGVQYRAGAVDELVEKVKWLAANRDAAREMGQRARKLFDERFRSDVIYPSLANHLEKVVSSYGNAISGEKRSQQLNG